MESVVVNIDRHFGIFSGPAQAMMAMLSSRYCAVASLPLVFTSDKIVQSLKEVSMIHVLESRSMNTNSLGQLKEN
jgi:hypothetical protein